MILADVNKRLAAILLSVGIVLIAAGAALALLPIHRGGYSCGSVLAAKTPGGLSGASHATTDCSTARDNRQHVALAVLLPGIVFVLAGGVVMIPGRPVA